MPAKVTGTSVELPFGTVQVPESRTKAAQGKGLLIAGVRPEHFEDASVMEPGKADAASTFKATVDVVEWLGNEAYAYVPFEAPPEVQKQLADLEHDLDGETLRTQLVISLDGASHIQAGQEADIWVNAAKMHLFDPATGENLTVDRSKAGVIPGDKGAAQAAPA
jgi:multiple sugar transport system ATP-binding protein